MHERAAYLHAQPGQKAAGVPLVCTLAMCTCLARLPDQHLLLGNLLIWGLPRARWARAEPGPAALRECLDAVADRAWAVRECLARLAPNAAAQAVLIDYGLAETGRQCQGATEPSGHGADAGAAREVRKCRCMVRQCRHAEQYDACSLLPSDIHCLLRPRTARLMCLDFPCPHTRGRG